MSGATQTGPMVAVRLFVEAFNRNDVAGAQAACTDATAIIDDFPPHEWSGSGATTRWFSEMARMGAEFGMSDPAVTLNEPRHVLVSDDRAYVVVPVDVTWRQDGERAERAGVMTMALREGAAGWRIAACAWTWS